MRRNHLFNGILFAIIFVSLSNAEIIINKAGRMQVMEGLGGFGGKLEWWSGDNPTSYYDANWVNLVVKDLGLSVMRDAPPPCFEDPNDNSDPAVLEVDKISTTTHPYGDHVFSTHVGLWKAFADAGMKKVIFSQWTPPPWMKQGAGGTGCQGGTNVCGGTLQPGMVEEFAERWAAFIKKVKALNSIDVYAISMENEPEWAQPYESMIMPPSTMRDCIKATGKRCEKEGLGKVKVFWPEVLHEGPFNDYVNTVCADPEANNYAHAAAIHYIGPWSTWQRVALSKNKPWWGTEMKANGTWQENFADCFDAVKNGCALWAQWYYSCNDGKLITNGQPTKSFYAMKMMYRFIRPGAVQYASSGAPSGMNSLAFYDSAQDVWTIVLNNMNGGAQNVSVSLNGGTGFPSSFEMYVTSSSLNCAKQANTLPSSVAVPAGSIVTLVNKMPELNSPLAIHNNAAASRFIARRDLGRAVRYYRPDGRRVTDDRSGLSVIVVAGKGTGYAATVMLQGR